MYVCVYLRARAYRTDVRLVLSEMDKIYKACSMHRADGNPCRTWVGKRQENYDL